MNLISLLIARQSIISAHSQLHFTYDAYCSLRKSRGLHIIMSLVTQLVPYVFLQSRAYTSALWLLSSTWETW